MNDYVSGGYYIVKTIPRPPDLSDILPDHLLTVSGCFTKVMRDVIQLQWDNYEDVQDAIADEVKEFGIEESRIAELVSWAKAQHNCNYIVFCEIGPPLELLNRFIRDASARLVGIGLDTNLLESFTAQLPKDINRGFGLAELVNEKRPLAEGGKTLGFEPLGFEGTSFHSWLCHYTPDKAHKRFGIRPNRLGLIDNFEGARRVTDYLLETGAEPAIWEPWLIVQYGPEASSR